MTVLERIHRRTAAAVSDRRAAVANLYYAAVAHPLPQRRVALSETVDGQLGLFVVHPYLTDDIEIRPIGLDHEKFAHSHWLKSNVADVEIVGNHHQI
jgi:hypothetical protein